MSEVIKPLSGRRVFLIFFLFFGVIVAVNTVFITVALDTHSGVVTEHAYDKGIAFNETLEKARHQPQIENEVTYEGGVLRWSLPVEGADVTARLLRNVQDGYDFDISLEPVGNGVYEAKPEMPLSGAWTAKLKAKWDNKEFQTSHDLIAP